MYCLSRARLPAITRTFSGNRGRVPFLTWWTFIQQSLNSICAVVPGKTRQRAVNERLPYLFCTAGVLSGAPDDNRGHSRTTARQYHCQLPFDHILGCAVQTGQPAVRSTLNDIDLVIATAELLCCYCCSVLGEILVFMFFLLLYLLF